MLLSPAIWIVAMLYLVTCDQHHQFRWNSKHHHHNHTTSYNSDSLGRNYGSAYRRQFHHVPSTVSPWQYVVRKSFGPFTTTTTTTTTAKPPSGVEHRMKLRLVPDDVKVRHKSRFPHLDSVMDRLDKYSVSTKRPKALQTDLYSMEDDNDDDDENEEDVFDDEEEPNVNDDYLLDAEDDNNVDEDTDYLEDDTAADDEEDVEDEDVVDEPTRGGRFYGSSSWSGSQQQQHKSRQTDINSNAVSGNNSPFTAVKWQMYGTKQRADETRRLHMQQQQLQPHRGAQTSQSSVNTAVFQHIMAMNTQSRCRRPLPRVVNVLREHPGHGPAGLTYVPHCTVLHRCSEDTGCCQDHNTRCGPKTQTQVHLYFYASTSAKTGNKVVELPFYNHTECACLPRGSTNSVTTENGGSTTEPKSARLLSRSNQLTPANIKQCNCPEEFVPSIMRQSDEQCICDCEDTNGDCLRMKKGKEYFSLKDRICINSSKCGSPVCEYGSYLRDTGRCPKLQEKFDAFAQVNVNRN